MFDDLDKVQRTVWTINNQIEFFDQMKPLLNISDEEAEEIGEELNSNDFDYLEIASFLSQTSEEPDAALVFDRKDTYWDIFNLRKTNHYLKEIAKLSQGKATLSHKRGLTQRDWRKRAEALGAL